MCSAIDCLRKLGLVWTTSEFTFITYPIDTLDNYPFPVLTSLLFWKAFC